VKLKDRIGLNQKPLAPVADAEPAAPARPGAPPWANSPDRAYQDLKLRIHRLLLDRVDLANLAKMDLNQAEGELRAAITELLGELAVPLSHRDRENLRDEILHEVYGLGPIEPLLRDPDISDILVNTSRQVYVERHGKLEPTTVMFRNDAHLLQIIDRIVSKVGRRIDESSPMVDARLPDGSRVNAIIPPLALDGPILSIRRFGRSPLTLIGDEDRGFPGSAHQIGECAVDRSGPGARIDEKKDRVGVRNRGFGLRLHAAAQALRRCLFKPRRVDSGERKIPEPCLRFAPVARDSR